MPERPPYGAYAAIMASFLGGVAVTSGLSRRLGRDPQCNTALDLVALSLATFKASRTLSHDEVTSFVRAPFVKGEAHHGDDEEPVEGGFEQALGELVTCSRCAGTWAAGGLTASQVLFPRFGRVLTWSLGAAAVNDFLQAGFSALTTKANELENAA